MEGSASTELSFQRTRLAAERTLLSVIRTSLSLISFGFTIHQVFKKLAEAQALSGSEAARNFGVVLVALGISILAIGIAYHVTFMVGMRHSRNDMIRNDHLQPLSVFPLSLSLLVGAALLAIGIAAIVSMLFHVGPFD